jgi:hypothetical protein
MSPFTVFHLEHKGSHKDEWGDLDIFEENIQRLLGVFSTRILAEDAIHRMRALPGFAEEQDCFFIDEEGLDEINWLEGYVTS